MGLFYSRRYNKTIDFIIFNINSTDDISFILEDSDGDTT